MSKEAYVKVTVSMVVPVRYENDVPTDYECLRGIDSYIRDNDPDLTANGTLQVVEKEVDEDSIC